MKDLNKNQLRTLKFMQRSNLPTVGSGDVARNFGIPQTTAIGVLKGMVKKGYITVERTRPNKMEYSLLDKTSPTKEPPKNSTAVDAAIESLSTLAAENVTLRELLVSIRDQINEVLEKD